MKKIILLSFSLLVMLSFFPQTKLNASSFTSPKVAVGDHFTVALKSNGTVWTWGDNGSGKLGDGTTTDNPYPKKIVGLDNIVDISAGHDFAIALKNDGTVWTWGDNQVGQLGDGTKVTKKTPIQVPGLSSVKRVYAEKSTSFVIKTDGTVWAWGGNGHYNLGLGDKTNRVSPVLVSGLNNIKDMSVGNKSVLALTETGNVWSWGDNTNGQIGDGTLNYRKTPYLIENFSSVISIASGAGVSMALKSDGTVFNWGNGYTNGNGNITKYKVPYLIETVNDVKFITVDDQRAFVIKNDKSIWGFGHNDRGGLGRGSSALNSSTRLPERVVTDYSFTPLTDIIFVDTGMYHTVAIKEDGTLWSWGSNTSDALGVGPIPGNYLDYAAQVVDINVFADDTPVYESINVNESKYISLLSTESKRFSFVPNSSGQVTISTENWQFDTDPVIRLYDQYGNMLAYDDDSADMLNALITYSVIQGEKYIIEVSGYQDGAVNCILKITQ